MLSAATKTYFTSITEAKILHGRVNPYDSPKIDLNCRDGPSGHDGIVFWNNSAASGRSGGRSGQFCAILLADKAAHLQTVYHGRTRLHKGMFIHKG